MGILLPFFTVLLDGQPQRGVYSGQRTFFFLHDNPKCGMRQPKKELKQI
jgi:hypothetical protein